ncbi:unnamed protein product [Pylaiella littoralis]
MPQEALIQENEVAQALAGGGCLFEDPSFPASATSLYRTPQQPPAGTLPAALAVWGRVSQQEVRRCHTPVTFPVDGAPLAAVAQGALGDSWLVSALNMTLLFPEVLKRVIVSDRHGDKGIYTLKLFKEGAWRYLHVDDRLPCSPTRAPHFCSSQDPNQVWAPLIEKAFAKLHGCYESLGRGSIEQGLRCLTGAPVLRTPLMMISLKHNSEDGAVSMTVNCGESEKYRRELWTKMKKWQKRGCLMGCCRSVHFDRVRSRQQERCGGGGGGNRHTGLMVGRGYGVRRVCDVSAEATRTRDAVSFKLVQLSCPWGLGQWRGDWSRHSGLWEKYPTIKGDLLRLLKQPEVGLDVYHATAGEVGGDGESGREGGYQAAAGTAAAAAAAAAVQAEESAREEEGSLFWMAFDDFTAEFSQARNKRHLLYPTGRIVLTCVSYSPGQESKGLHRKSYGGRWIPGDPLTGSGGGCARLSFLQNPFYPITIQRNATTVTVCLSVWDRVWQTDPSRGGPAIGYYVVRLTGSKPRLTKLRSSKIAARSAAFLVGTQSAGEHTFDSGRYAIVPVTVKPLHSAEAFTLDLTADNTVEWEQTDDIFRDLDQELRLSDDERDSPTATSGALANSKPAVVSVLREESVEFEDLDGPPGNKVVEALHEQIADLSSLVAELQGQKLGHRTTPLIHEVGG